MDPKLGIYLVEKNEKVTRIITKYIRPGKLEIGNQMLTCSFRELGRREDKVEVN